MNQKARLTATVFITDKCNLACKYCYEENKEFKTNTEDNIDRFVRFLYTDERYCHRPDIVFDFIGGEALIEWRLMEYAMKRFVEEGRARRHPWVTERKFIFFVTTNGTLFSVPEVKAFLERWPCLQVGLSVDGNKKAHDLNRVYLNGKGSYDKIMETFDWWKDRYHQNLVKGTMNRDTLPMLADMLINQIHLGMEPWANPIYEERWTQADAEEYYRQLKKVVDFIFHRKLFLSCPIIGRPRPKETGDMKTEGYCGSCTHMITLGLDGKLYPCHRFATAKHKYDIGDVIHGLDDGKVQRFRAGQIRINEEVGTTKQPLCYAANYDLHGDFHYYNNTEVMTEAEYRAYDYFMERMKSVTL